MPGNADSEMAVAEARFGGGLKRDISIIDEMVANEGTTFESGSSLQLNLAE